MAYVDDPRYRGRPSPWSFLGPLFLLLCVVSVLAWLVGRRPMAVRLAAAVALLVVLAVGVPADWRYSPYLDFHYRQFATQSGGRALWATTSGANMSSDVSS